MKKTIEILNDAVLDRKASEHSNDVVLKELAAASWQELTDEMDRDVTYENRPMKLRSALLKASVRVNEPAYGAFMRNPPVDSVIGGAETDISILDYDRGECLDAGDIRQLCTHPYITKLLVNVAR
jgi:hypothetical protein